MGSQYLRHDHADYNGSIGAAGTLLPASTALNRDGVQAIDCRHQNQVVVQLTGTWVGTVTFQGSNDGGANWVAVAANLTDGATAPSTTATANGIYVIPVTFKDFRAQVTAYTSGTIVGRSYVSSGAQVLGNISAPAGQSVTVGTSVAQGASSYSHIMSAATTNATSVKATVGVVNALVVSNNGATVAYFKLYNKNSAPVVGTDTPIATILVPINGTVTLQGSAPGMRMASGIAYAITGGPAVADTTAVALSQVTGMINYT